MKYYFKFLSLLLFSFVAISSNAQEKWGLEKCIKYALDNNLDIKMADIDLQYAEISKTQATHSRYPFLSASSGVGWNFGKTIDPTSNDFITQTFFSNNLSLNTGVTLFNGFRINNTIKQSKLDLEASKYDRDQSVKNVSLNVATAYLGVLFAQENLQTSRNQLALSQDQLDQINKLIQAGSRPENDRLDIEAQIAMNEEALIGFENNLEIAFLNLKQLLRLDPAYEMELEKPGDIDASSDPEILGFDEVYRSALSTQSYIRAGELKAESAELGIKIAQSALMPSISVGGSLGSTYSNQGRKADGSQEILVDQRVIINGEELVIQFPQDVPNFVDNPYFDQLDENLSYGFGINLSVPIYNNYSNKLNVDRARLNSINSQNTLEQLKDNLKTTVQQALADARSAKRKLFAAEKSQKAQSAAYDNANKKFELGAINTYEYITAKNQLENAEVNLIIAKYDYLFKCSVLDFYMGNPIRLK